MPSSGASSLAMLIASLICFTSLGGVTGLDGTNCVTDDCSICKDCYSGPKCQGKVNNKPTFLKKNYQTVVDMNGPDFGVGYVVLQVNALDPDSSICASCPCAQLTYQIRDSDAEGEFAINAAGQITIQTLTPNKMSYEFKIAVSNLGDFKQEDPDYAIVKIDLISERSDVIKSRSKRSTVAPKENTTFTLTKTSGPSTYITYGDTVSFKLDIEFPNKLTDMTVELFAPDKDTEVMLLCNWNITEVGSKTNVNRTDVMNNIVAEGRGGSKKWPYTRVVFNLGNITLSGTDATDAKDYAVTIVFDAVMIKTSVSLTNNSKHWVSAGAEFNNDDEIWVGQASFNAITTEDTTVHTPNVTLSGDSELVIGRTNVYTLDMVLPQQYIDPLTVDIMAPLNNTEIISLCSAIISNLGDSYKCINPSPTIETHKMFPYLQNFYKTTINFGNVVNQKYTSSPTADDNRIIVKFYLRVNSSAETGTNTYLGAAVLIGSKKIWAGATPVSVKAATPLTNLTGSAMTVAVTTPTTNLAPYQTGYTDIVVTTQTLNSTTDVSVTVTSEDATIPRFRICSIVIMSAGRNFPCLTSLVGTNAMPIKYETTKPTTAAWVTDKATLSMTGLHNTGLFTGSTDNVYTVRVYYSPTNNTANVNPNTAKLNIRTEWGGGSDSKDITITFQNAVNTTVISAENMPNFTFALIGSLTSTVPQGTGRNLEMKVTVSQNQMYNPASIELILPYSAPGAYFTVCKAEIQSVGKGLPCVVAGTVNAAIVYTSKNTTDPSKKDRAVLTLGAICSNNDPTLTSTDLTFTLKYMIYLKDSGITNNEQKWISAGMMISTTQLWVGQIKMTATTTVPSDTSDVEVYLSRDDKNGTEIYQNDVAVYRTIIKVEPGKIPAVTATFSFTKTGTGDFGICSVLIASRGRCITCGKDEITYTNYTSNPNFNSQAVVDFGRITNVNCTPGGAFYKHSYEDDNSLVLLVVVKSPTDATGQHSLKGEIKANSNSAKTVTGVLDVTTGKPPNGTDPKPTYKKSVVPLFDALNYTDSHFGQAFKMYMDVILPRGSRQYLDIHVGNKLDAKIFDIANLNVYSAGLNIPCVKPGVPQAVYSRRTNSKQQDFAAINIGSCVNIGVFPDTEENNRVRLEIIGRVWMSVATSGSTQLYSLTFLNQNYAQVSDGQVSYTEGNVTDYMGISSLNLTGNINQTYIYVRPGEDFKIQLEITVPYNTLYNKVMIDFRSPNASGTDSAVVTVKNITFLSAGMNLALFENEPYPVLFESSFNSSQMDKAFVDLGIFQNTGVSHRLNIADAVDPDSFVVEYHLQLTDNYNNSNGTDHWMSFGFSTGPQILLVNKSITVLRSDTTPELNLTASAEDPNKIYEASETIAIAVDLSHLNESSQEPRNCYLNVYFPSFLQFGTTTGTSYIGTVTDSPSATRMRYIFPHLYFTDEISLNFTLIVKDVQLPGNRLQGYATPVVEFVYNVFNRSGNKNNDKWLRKATAVPFQVKGKTPTASASCNSDLGMGSSSTIQDCQISAFMSPFPGHLPAQVRPSGNGWKPHTRGGTYAEKRFITVLFGTNKYVSSLEILNITGAALVTKIRVFKTMDGRAFVKVSDHTLTWTSTKATVTLASQTLCRGIRISALESQDNNDIEVGFKMNLFGCDHADTAVKFDACKTKEYDALPDPLSSQHYYRGFLYTGSGIFYCDYIPQQYTNFAIRARCFKAEDSSSSTWRDLGPLVGAVIGYHTSGETYGLSPSFRSYVMSSDHGATWKAINKGKWDIAFGKGGIKTPTAIPWTTKSAFKANITGTTCTDYAEGNWNFCYDGIYHNNAKVMEWNTCCK